MSKEKYLSCILFKNQKGLLGKVATILGDNDVNIESITISSFNNDESIQKVIVYTTGIKSQNVLNTIIKSMPEVLDVFTFNGNENVIEKEVLLIKIENKNPNIIELTKLIKELDGKSIFMNNTLTIYEVIEDNLKATKLIDDLIKISPDLDISRSFIITSKE